MRYLQDDWDSDFDDESVSQVGGPGGAPAAAAQNNYAQHQVRIVLKIKHFRYFPYDFENFCKLNQNAPAKC